jgi:WD40 repeat protein
MRAIFLCLAAAALLLGTPGYPSGAQVKNSQRPAAWGPLDDALGDPLPSGAVLRLGTGRLRQGAAVACVTWSPDCLWVASGGGDTVVRLWDADNGREIRHFARHGSAIRHISLTPDGNLAASVDKAGVLIVWQTATGTEQWMNVHDENAAVVFAANGKRFASVSPQGRACLIETAKGEMIRDFRTDGLQAPVTCLDWSKDGKTLVTADTRNNVHVFDAALGKVRFTVVPGAKVECLALAPHGKTLATAGKDKKITLWDTATGQEIRSLEGHRGVVNSLSWSPDSKRLASASDDSTARVWDAEQGQEILKFAGHHALVQCVSFSPDGKRVASGGTGKDNSVRIWDAATGKETVGYDNHTGLLATIVLLADGKTLLTAASDDVIRLWDRQTGKGTGSFSAPHSRPKAIAVTPDGKWLAASGGDRALRLLELPAGTVAHLFETGSAVNSVGIGPDAQWLVSAGKNNKTFVWEVATGKARELQHPPEQMSAIAFSPDGKVFCTGSGKGLLRLWDVATGREVGRMAGHKNNLERIQFSPDGKLLGTISSDSTAGIWDLASGKEVRHFDKLRVGGGLAFSADGRTLATGGGDHLIRLWEVATGKPRGVLQGHQGLVAGLTFLPDGKTLLSGSGDSTALCWDLTGRGKAADAPLSADEFQSEWRQLHGGDALRAYRALWKLAANPKLALARLEKELRPFQPVDPKAISQGIADLESDKLTVREAAKAELTKAGDVAWPALRDALAKRPSLELQTRVRQLLGNQDDLLPFPERLVLVRSLELLEQIPAADALALVQMLADGAAEAWLTQEAKMMARRMKAAK